MKPSAPSIIERENTIRSIVGFLFSAKYELLIKKNGGIQLQLHLYNQKFLLLFGSKTNFIN